MKLWLIESTNHDYDENESAVAWAETADDARELFWALEYSGPREHRPLDVKPIELGDAGIVHVGFHAG
jgi:hypothetical protein